MNNAQLPKPAQRSKLNVCDRCKDTGMTYEGNGHRMQGYPFAERNVSTSCSCDLGRALDRGEAVPTPPAREVTDEDKAKVESRKASFSKRLDRLGGKWSAEYQKRISHPGYKAPAWMVEQ